MRKNLIEQLLNEIEKVKDDNYDGFYKLTFDEKTGFSLSKDERCKMKDLGQEALDEMNRLLLNQKQLKMKLEKIGDYSESATIKKQLADASKTIERLQEQLREAQNLIIYCSSGDHLGFEIMCENYMIKHHLSKRGVKRTHRHEYYLKRSFVCLKHL